MFLGAGLMPRTATVSFTCDFQQGHMPRVVLPSAFFASWCGPGAVLAPVTLGSRCHSVPVVIHPDQLRLLRDLKAEGDAPAPRDVFNLFFKHGRVT